MASISLDELPQREVSTVVKLWVVEKEGGRKIEVESIGERRFLTLRSLPHRPCTSEGWRDWRGKLRSDLTLPIYAGKNEADRMIEIVCALLDAFLPPF